MPSFDVSNVSSVPAPLDIFALMLNFPVWLELNAMRLPLGDQTGRPSFAGFNVKRVRTPRIASISHTSGAAPPTAPHEAIRFPSGDNSTSDKPDAGASILLTTLPVRSIHFRTCFLSVSPPVRNARTLDDADTPERKGVFGSNETCSATMNAFPESSCFLTSKA